METSEDVLSLKKIKHEWRIKSFRNYLNFIDEHESLSISSKEFKIEGGNNLAFFFKITIFSRSICCYLCRSPNTRYTKLMGKMSLKDNRSCGDHLITKKFKIDYSTHVEATPEYLTKLIFNSTELLSKKWAYHNNNLHYGYGNNDYDDYYDDSQLLINCELTVLDHDIKIEPIYTPQPYPSLKDHFKNLLQSEIDSDIVFEVDGKEFKAHKSILSVRSPVFAAMFKHNMVEKKTSRVKIVDISKGTFELLLNFIYTDEVNRQLDFTDGQSLLKAASKYQLGGLQNLCASQLFKLITVSNAKIMRNIARDYHLPDFEKNIDAFIRSHKT